MSSPLGPWRGLNSLSLNSLSSIGLKRPVYISRVTSLLRLLRCSGSLKVRGVRVTAVAAAIR